VLLLGLALLLRAPIENALDIDKFRKFVLESKLLDLFEIDKEEVEKIKTDEIALMKFGFRYLKYILMLEETLKIKEEYKKKKQPPEA
ncbi:MAG: hypothetical protein L7F78_05745, partial [Syntrophales bacterium LBB04]|nr:hypothetical protein [Syntrophales bacterium LBB04]